jgi:hypothetical protein
MAQVPRPGLQSDGQGRRRPSAQGRLRHRHLSSFLACGQLQDFYKNYYN